MVHNNLREFVELKPGQLRLAQKKVEICKKIGQNAEFFIIQRFPFPDDPFPLAEEHWEELLPSLHHRTVSNHIA
jgi:hypothetical protein